jgi:hypothetical protein
MTLALLCSHLRCVSWRLPAAPNQAHARNQRARLYRFSQLRHPFAREHADPRSHASRAPIPNRAAGAADDPDRATASAWTTAPSTNPPHCHASGFRCTNSPDRRSTETHSRSPTASPIRARENQSARAALRRHTDPPAPPPPRADRPAQASGSRCTSSPIERTRLMTAT